MIEPLLLAEQDGGSSPAEMVSAVRWAGYDNGVVAAKNSAPDVRGLRRPLTGAVVSGPDGRDRISRLRPRVDLLLAEARHGAGALARDSRVDGLLGLAGSAYMDEKLLRSAANHDVAVVFDFSPVIESRNRFGVMKRFNANAATCRSTGCPAMITAGASSVYGVRGHRELFELALLSGFAEEQAGCALELPRKMLEVRSG